MTIRRATAIDHARMLEIWLASVRKTHSFVTEEHIQEMLPAVSEYLSNTNTTFWVVCDDIGTQGFMGLAGNNMESLFLAPEFMGRGAGRLLVQHAQRLFDLITLDVNEQNTQAKGFYEACGFEITGRSVLDGQGRPYPLLFMKWERSPLPIEEGKAMG